MKYLSRTAAYGTSYVQKSSVVLKNRLRKLEKQQLVTHESHIKLDLTGATRLRHSKTSHWPLRGEIRGRFSSNTNTPTTGSKEVIIDRLC